MKLMFVIGSMYYSGAEKVFRDIIKGLTVRGYLVEVILLNDKETHFEKGIVFHSAFSEGIKISRVFKRLKLIRKIVSKCDAGLVVSFGNVANINVTIALLFMKTRILLCERNDPNYDPRTRTKRLIRNLIYKFADFYMFQTNEIKAYFNSKIQNKSWVIPNPIVLDKPPKIDYDCNLLVTTARLDDYQKQLLKLIEIVSIVHNKVDFRMDIYGDGPDKQKIQSYINEKKVNDFIFLKGKSNDIFNDLSRASIFVLNSRFEGMPNSLMEALAAGLACLTSDFSGGGARALIKNDENGMIALDDHDFEIKLLNLLTSRDLRERLGTKAKEILDIHSLNNTLDLWESMIKKIIEM